MTDTAPQPARVAVLGLGAMGSRIARRLLDAGHHVTVWNRTASACAPLLDAGATRAETPRAAAAAVGAGGFVLAMVADDAASRAVWLGEGADADGALAGLEDGATALEVSTITPDWTEELAEAARAVGRQVLACPVVGSRPQAEAGELIVLVAGDREVAQAARPVFDAFAGRVFDLGDQVAHAAVAKLAVNTFFATQLAATGELMAFLQRAGVADEHWLELFTALPITAPPVAMTMRAAVADRFAPMFPIALVAKDLRYFEAAADRAGARHALGSIVGGLFAEAVEAGLGADNIHGIAKLFRASKSSMQTQ